MLLQMEKLKVRAGELQMSMRKKRNLDGWILPKQTSSLAPLGKWTNIDMDVTPPERRIWTPLNVLGYWISDVVSLEQEHRCQAASKLKNV